MNSITKWSQDIFISSVLFIAALIAITVQLSKSGNSPVIAVGLCILAVLIFWGLSKALKLQNPTLSAALFVIGGGSIFNSLARLTDGAGSLSLVFWIIGFILPFILFKHVYQTTWGRAIWLVIFNGMVISLIVVGGLFILTSKDKNIDRQGALNSYINKGTKTSQVDPLQLQQAKSMFPSGFPLPNDSSVTAAHAGESKTIDNFKMPSITQITFTTEETTEQILATYTTALKNQGLSVRDRSENAEQKTIAGNRTRINSNGIEVLDTDNLYEIGVIITNLRQDSRQVTLWVTQ